ncbi:hypothetical protein AB1Y20_000552 [Prymnesium parvum]|uniref:Uncharacterized protein n=1 Tax=Prymnesium parvum TaxID=97485 RepID=A0AB34K6W1_PRYPA
MESCWLPQILHARIRAGGATLARNWVEVLTGDSNAACAVGADRPVTSTPQPPSREPSLVALALRHRHLGQLGLQRVEYELRAHPCLRAFRRLQPIQGAAYQTL